MFTLNARAATILNALIDGLSEPGTNGAARTIDNCDSVFMPVHVERIADRLYSVAHYHQSAGDAVCDPDCVYWLTPKGTFCPISFEQGGVAYRVAVELNDEGTAPARWRERECRQQASFANDWMVNIASQQGGLAAIRKAVAAKS